MNYEGKVYRPWMEADSFLIQTTIGCTHNKCTFCDMFRETRFRIRDIEDIFKDIDDAGTSIHHVQSIFLIDGNVLALKTVFLVKILNKITSVFRGFREQFLGRIDQAIACHPITKQEVLQTSPW